MDFHKKTTAKTQTSSVAGKASSFFGVKTNANTKEKKNNTIASMTNGDVFTFC